MNTFKGCRGPFEGKFIFECIKWTIYNTLLLTSWRKQLPTELGKAKPLSL
jgi:hypothetical protein